MHGRLMSSPARIAVLCALTVFGAQGALAQHLPDTVTTDVLRVCGDPGNMPFSERKEDGFENKIAAIIADELKIKVRYYWLTQGPGFVRNTLGTGLCDVIMGQAFGSDLVQTTNPYYRSAYTPVTRAGELDVCDGPRRPAAEGQEHRRDRRDAAGQPDGRTGPRLGHEGLRALPARPVP